MKLIKKYIEDILIFAGLALIIVATFILSAVAGLYVAGVSLLCLGVWFVMYPPEER